MPTLNKLFSNDENLKS